MSYFYASVHSPVKMIHMKNLKLVAKWYILIKFICLQKYTDNKFDYFKHINNPSYASIDVPKWLSPITLTTETHHNNVFIIQYQKKPLLTKTNLNFYNKKSTASLHFLQSNLNLKGGCTNLSTHNPFKTHHNDVQINRPNGTEANIILLKECVVLLLKIIHYVGQTFVQLILILQHYVEVQMQCTFEQHAQEKEMNRLLFIEAEKEKIKKIEQLQLARNERQQAIRTTLKNIFDAAKELWIISKKTNSTPQNTSSKPNISPINFSPSFSLFGIPLPKFWQILPFLHTKVKWNLM